MNADHSIQFVSLLIEGSGLCGRGEGEGNLFLNCMVILMVHIFHYGTVKSTTTGTVHTVCVFHHNLFHKYNKTIPLLKNYI